jgi:hypothetical protein
MTTPKFRFGLQTLFFLVLCIGGFLAAYRSGLDRGYANGEQKWHGEKHLPHAYYVGDLAGPVGQFPVQELENLVTVNLTPTQWDTVGGPASLEVLYDRQKHPVFVITHNQGVQEAVASLFKELRAAH